MVILLAIFKNVDKNPKKAKMEWSLPWSDGILICMAISKQGSIIPHHRSDPSSVIIRTEIYVF